MRTRTIILVLAAVLLINSVVVLGVWLWSRGAAANLARSSKGNKSTSLPVPDLPVPEAAGAWAEIESPREGEAVPRRFRVSGRCGSVPSGSRLLFVIDSGNDVYSPKLPPANVTGDAFEGGANEYGVPTGGTFTLCAFLVSEEGFQHITDWHAQGKATGKYPPFRGSMPGGVPLARVKLRVAKS